MKTLAKAILNAAYRTILFSTVSKFVPTVVRYWAYDARYNAWAHCPKFGDLLAKAHGCPNFDYAGFRRSRALERDAIVLNVHQFRTVHGAVKVGA